jgi:hypothetical protein
MPQYIALAHDAAFGPFDSQQEACEFMKYLQNLHVLKRGFYIMELQK